MSQTLHTVYSPNGEKRAEVESGLLFLSVYCYDGNLITDVYHVSEIHQAKITSYKSFLSFEKICSSKSCFLCIVWCLLRFSKKPALRWLFF